MSHLWQRHRALLALILVAVVALQLRSESLLNKERREARAICLRQVRAQQIQQKSLVVMLLLVENTTNVPSIRAHLSPIAADAFTELHALVEEAGVEATC